MKKIAIIGGGVAGLTAAIYALRANAEVTVFEQFGLGGLVANIDKIENFPSLKSVEGWQLAQDIASHAKSLKPTVVRQRVISLQKQDGQFVIKTEKGEYTFPSVVVASGTSHNKMGFEQDYVGKGVSYCATCDGNFYKDKPVAVVGGGNSAVREALYLADLCKTVYVVAPQSSLTCDETSARQLLAKNNVTVLFNATAASIEGEEFVSALNVHHNGSVKKLDVDGIFVAIGSTPVTSFIQIDGVELNNGFIVVDGKCQSNVEGLFACGDVTFGFLKQIVTACGDGAKAGTFASAFAAKAGK